MRIEKKKGFFKNVKRKGAKEKKKKKNKKLPEEGDEGRSEHAQDCKQSCYCSRYIGVRIVMEI